MKIGFLGLGKLGLSCALAVEQRGHAVIGHGGNAGIIANIAPWRYIPPQDGVRVVGVGSYAAH